MPYEVVKRGGKWQVRKKDGGRVLGTHSSKQEAMRQVRAIYANEKPHG